MHFLLNAQLFNRISGLIPAREIESVAQKEKLPNSSQRYAKNFVEWHRTTIYILISNKCFKKLQIMWNTFAHLLTTKPWAKRLSSVCPFSFYNFNLVYCYSNALFRVLAVLALFAFVLMLFYEPRHHNDDVCTLYAQRATNTFSTIRQKTTSVMRKRAN